MRFDLGKRYACRNTDQEWQRLAAITLEGISYLVEYCRHGMGLDSQNDNIGEAGDLDIVVSDFDTQRVVQILHMVRMHIGNNNTLGISGIGVYQSTTHSATHGARANNTDTFAAQQ